ncbi:MAG: glycosyltransferase [Immundisolibacter sp.]|uniref:glycosyltransferase n=1 Tax=Immundisolibacter sp. TaxID=1934948 RepID=UPI003EDE94E1
MTHRLALLLLSLTGGGVERSTLRLARECVHRGLAVDLLVCRPEGELAHAVPDGVRLVPLADTGTIAGRLAALRAAGRDWPALLRPVLLAPHASRALRHLPALVQYLEREQPVALLSAKTPVNLMALWARRLADAPTRLVISERAQLSAIATPDRSAKRSQQPQLAARFYGEADAIVAISIGVADDLARLTGLDRRRITVIYNPVVDEDFATRAAESVPHPWLTDDGPLVVLTVGRLHRDKDYPALLHAFATLRGQRSARLLILGEGPQRAELAALATRLGISADLAMPGFCANPLPAMRQAAVFALTSRAEGFGNVLVEALACGCPVVSTDCPSGPREILDGGRYGRLVPVGDIESLAEALAISLDETPQRDALRARGGEFSVATAANAYLRLLLPDTQASIR